MSLKMTKISRNAPCPCGSGKKYKKCCLQNDLQKVDVSKIAEKPKVEQSMDSAKQADMEQLYKEVQELDDLSNSVVDLIQSKRFDAAEKVCQKLLREYPDQVDGLDRLAELHMAKGEKGKTLYYHRKIVEFMHSHEGFDLENIKWHTEQADRLEQELNS